MNSVVMVLGQKQILIALWRFSSMLYDTLNHLTIDAQIAPLQVSERDLLLEHLNKVSSEDMLFIGQGVSMFSGYFFC